MRFISIWSQWLLRRPGSCCTWVRKNAKSCHCLAMLAEEVNPPPHPPLTAIYVLEVNESMSGIPTDRATMFGLSRISRINFERSTSSSRGTDELCLINFHNFFTIYVFEIKESTADPPTELNLLWVTSRIPLEPEVVLDFRGPPNRKAQ